MKDNIEIQTSHQDLINSFLRLSLHAAALSLMLAHITLSKYTPLHFSKNVIITGYYFHYSESSEAERQSSFVFK